MDFKELMYDIKRYVSRPSEGLSGSDWKKNEICDVCKFFTIFFFGSLLSIFISITIPDNIIKITFFKGFLIWLSIMLVLIIPVLILLFIIKTRHKLKISKKNVDDNIFTVQVFISSYESGKIELTEDELLELADYVYNIKSKIRANRKKIDEEINDIKRKVKGEKMFFLKRMFK